MVQETLSALLRQVQRRSTVWIIEQKTDFKRSISTIYQLRHVRCVLFSALKINQVKKSKKSIKSSISNFDLFFFIAWRQLFNIGNLGKEPEFRSRSRPEPAFLAGAVAKKLQSFGSGSIIKEDE